MKTRTNIKTLAVVAALGLASALAHAGPEDQFTKYPVGISIAGVSVGAIADSGGTTTISFEDAKRMQFLDAAGDPIGTPDGTQRMGGTGGGSVTCHIFRDVAVTVQPRNADGTANGPARTITVTIFVPKKPGDQTGGNDAEKTKKTKSVPTKIGANVCGATIDGHKLDFTDVATNVPTKNNRSTGWRQADGGGGNGGADKRAPIQEDDNYEDEAVFEPHLDNLLINDVPIQLVQLNLAPVSCMGQQAAQQLGLEMMGPEVLDFENHQILFHAGLTDILPDQQNELILPMGRCLVEIPTLGGDPVVLEPVRVFVLPQGDPWLVALGGNALVPPQTSMWLDSDTHQLFWDFDFRCPGDFNADGVVNTLDVLEFLNAWSAQLPEADVNGDGLINTLDVLEFLNAWTAGCE
ncbi:MAG: hypothetical protein HND58_18760 [Planctomycetota bacterium]|nr:MAG: hypothetical protein HND58_18760 [Planctomycetota bacterium]